LVKFDVLRSTNPLSGHLYAIRPPDAVKHRSPFVFTVDILAVSRPQTNCVRARRSFLGDIIGQVGFIVEADCSQYRHMNRSRQDLCQIANSGLIP
jgi:hypothetical protein